MSLAGCPQTCPACDAVPRPSITLRQGVRLLECPVCCLRWWPWPPFDPSAFYDQNYFQSDQDQKGYSDYSALEPGVRRTARARLQRIGRLLAGQRPECRILDLGCGTGCFLDEARRAGWSVEGVEVSEYAARQARERDLNVRCAPLEDLILPAQTYDCVTLWDVIEHVRDPRGVIAATAAALRPGGVLALSTGDVTSWCARLSGRRWHLYTLPEHLFFFSPNSLRRLIRAAGCEPVRTVDEVNWVPVRYIVERLGKTLLGRSATMTSAWSRWLVPATLFDVLGIYARKSS